jgi:hypothetical protein
MFTFGSAAAATPASEASNNTLNTNTAFILNRILSTRWYAGAFRQGPEAGMHYHIVLIEISQLYIPL